MSLIVWILGMFIFIQIVGSFITAFLILVGEDVSDTFVHLFSCNEPTCLMRRYLMLILITPIYVFCYFCITISNKLQNSDELEHIVQKDEREN